MGIVWSKKTREGLVNFNSNNNWRDLGFFAKRLLVSFLLYIEIVL